CGAALSDAPANTGFLFRSAGRGNVSEELCMNCEGSFIWE
ncbi:hypothetical protein HMPREF1986_00182, partial [Oribacterium sp. oral taxon 078 str. F0263]